MHEKIEHKKKNMSQLVRKNDFTTIEYNNNNSFLDGTNNFNSDVFSNLNYQDLNWFFQLQLVSTLLEHNLNQSQYHQI